ncbi:hypothetical protein AM501_05535 [Aneurinibacillus migulanus]|nr:hypothetical protein TS64_11650 [Aneurinibacillus migulanus]KPD09222.1 hypothetical protein AM501_05535 [Aneurinibacillus migulanus]
MEALQTTYSVEELCRCKFHGAGTTSMYSVNNNRSRTKSFRIKFARFMSNGKGHSGIAVFKLNYNVNLIESLTTKKGDGCDVHPNHGRVVIPLSNHGFV